MNASKIEFFLKKIINVKMRLELASFDDDLHIPPP
jgi:hypothetical protein